MPQEFTLKQGTMFSFGNVFIETPADYPFIFPIDTTDQLAELLAHNPKIYADHREQLFHKETVERDVDGERKQVVIGVIYGVGGARNELTEAAFDEHMAALAGQRAHLVELAAQEAAPAAIEDKTATGDENPPAGGESDAVN
jgi:hypothetical protein